MTDAIASSTPATSATSVAATSGSATTPAKKTELDKLKTAAKAFEAIFVRQMIHSMRTASVGEGMFDSSESEQFRDMSDSKMADNISEKGGLHIADMLVKQFGARLSGSAAATGTTGATAGATTTTAAATTATKISETGQ